MKKEKIGVGQIILMFCLGIFAIICLMPMLLIVVVSFSSDESISKNGYSFFPAQWSLKAWEYVAGYGSQLLVSYSVTIFITVFGTIFGLAVMSMFAYSLSRKCFQLRTQLTVLMLITMLFYGGQLSTYVIETTVYGLKDNIFALIFPGISAMNIIILRTYIQTNIPDSLIESAKIDGAGEFRTFWQIIFPMMKPSVASVGFMVAIGIWNDWQKAYMYISSPSKTPLQLLLIRIEKNIEFLLNDNIPTEQYIAIAQNIPKESGRMAILLTALGPIMIAYPFFQKYFVAGLTVGAVKG